MNLDAISIGKNPPKDINVVIEIPQGSGAIKYEVDKDSGALFVDRFLGTAMNYPANYGFVPNTLGEDGDPVDVLVVTPFPVIHGGVIRSRPIGVLKMADEKGQDEKVIAVPVSKTSPYFDKVQSCADLPDILIKQIEHFFEHYKDLEAGKWVKIQGWGDAAEAEKIIQESIDRASLS
jgi:inorganic pyrophosphatase